jgi:hypothetical protein
MPSGRTAHHANRSRNGAEHSAVERVTAKGTASKNRWEATLERAHAHGCIGSTGLRSHRIGFGATFICRARVHTDEGASHSSTRAHTVYAENRARPVGLRAQLARLKSSVIVVCGACASTYHEARFACVCFWV